MPKARPEDLYVNYFFMKRYDIISTSLKTTICSASKKGDNLNLKHVKGSKFS